MYLSRIKFIHLGYLTQNSDVSSYETALNKPCLQCNAVCPKHFSLKAAAQKKIKYTLVKIFMELHLVVQLAKICSVSMKGFAVKNHCVPCQI